MRIKYLKYAALTGAVLAAFIVALVSVTPAQAQSGCPTPANLQVGGTGYVLPGLPNALRNLPGTTAPSTVIGHIQGGEWFTVLGGPTCVDGYNWWNVQTSTLTGWTADGNFGERWISSFQCDWRLSSRLRPGISGRVTPGDPNSIRSMPGSGARLGNIPGGGVFSVLSGPQCDSVGRIWWRVNYQGIIGWTAEGEGSTYWLEPVAGVITPTPTPVTTCTLPTRLRAGTTGMVTPGLPNVLRAAPGTSSNRIGRLTEGAIFTVLNGPVCADGFYWWQVTAAGMVGWTAEGQAPNQYWVDPLVCGNGLVSRVAPGMRARVTPGLPNRLRNLPSEFYGLIIGRVPAGSPLHILNSFHCDERGRMWWLVSYYGIIGWTVEGDNGVYWLEPA